MQEVTVSLQFTRPCLGNVRQNTRHGICHAMPKDASGTVIFLPTWWAAGMRYAAKVYGQAYEEVKAVDWAMPVSGELGTWKRYVERPNQKRKGYAVHEAFLVGTVIRVSAVLPDGLSLPVFTELLGVCGTYRGISPFQHQTDKYGMFVVASVLPTIRAGAL